MAQQRATLMGLGIMGTGMARRLLGAGFALTVYNRDRRKAEALKSEGARLAASPREAAAQSEIVVCMVADDPASRGLWLGDEGALAGAARGTTLVECSTLSVDWVRELGAAAAECGCELLDAPVTGSQAQAAGGELNFLVGGSTGALEKARPALSVMGRSITHLGPGGSGALLKLINNFLCGVQAASIAQALRLIEKGGLDANQSIDVLASGAPGSPLFKTVTSRARAGDFAPKFRLRLMAKDLAYAIEEAERRGVALTTATAALEMFQQAAAGGAGDQDFSAILNRRGKG